MWYTVPTVLFLIRAIHQGSDAISPAARGIIWVKFWAYNHAISSPEPSLPLSSGTGKRRPLGSCSQSRPQSPRYPCPAERENEDLLRWLNRVMQDRGARASDLNRKFIFSFFLLFS